MSVPAVLPRISKEMQVAGNAKFLCFQSKFRFFDIDREKPWKPGEGSSIFEERHLIPLVFIAKQFFSLFCDTGRGGNLRWAWKLILLNTIHPFFEEHHLIPLVFIAK